MKVPFLGGSLVSLPYCDVGGCLTRDVDVCEALLSKGAALAAQRKASRCELRWGKHSGATPLANLLVVEKVRMVLDLPEDSQALLASLKSRPRSSFLAMTTSQGVGRTRRHCIIAQEKKSPTNIELF
jgi:hypothetical protein